LRTPPLSKPLQMQLRDEQALTQMVAPEFELSRSLVEAVTGVAGITMCTAATAAYCLFNARSQLAAVGTVYSMFAHSAPLTCSITTATIKGVCSDLFAQLVVEKRRQPEWRRTLAFCSFGAVYLGAYAHYKYTFLYSFLFGSAKTVPIITTKILADLLISAPLIYYPIYYGFKGALFGSARSELRKYFSAHGIAMVLRYWAVWTPTFVVMWTLIPVHMRIPFVCVVSLVWQVALSTLSYVSSPDGRTDGRDSPAAPARPEDRFVDVVMREGGDDIASIRRCPRRRGVLRLRGSWLGMSRP